MTPDTTPSRLIVVRRSPTSWRRSSPKPSRLRKPPIEPAKTVILDTIGVALAAVERPIGTIITAHVAETGGATGTATVLGAGLKTSPQLAALANGTLANALDFDDGSHLATHILPAALAVAEHHRPLGRGRARCLHGRARGERAAHTGHRREAAGEARADPSRLVARRPRRPDRGRDDDVHDCSSSTAARPPSP